MYGLNLQSGVEEIVFNSENTIHDLVYTNGRLVVANSDLVILDGSIARTRQIRPAPARDGRCVRTSAAENVVFETTYGLHHGSPLPARDLHMRRILFVFLDGVGLGPSGMENPLSLHDGPAFRQLSNGAPWTRALSEIEQPHHLVRRLDATLGIEGLPQSGTGQATLLTGINCAERVGRHFGPFPHSATYDALDHENLFHRVQALDVSATPAAFANAFPPQFFESSPRRWTVTTRCCAAADVPLRNLDALRNARAIPADLTASAWREMLGLDVSPRSVAEAARDLARTHGDHLLTLFEYFYTDKVGHGRMEVDPSTLLERLDRFLAHLLDHLDPDTDTLLVTSDHGNLENTAHTRHTRNPVPLFVYGWAAPYFADACDLTHVTPGIVRALREGNASV